VFAVEKLFADLNRRLPVMISGTITDASGRTLSGQTAEAFWNSLSHSQPMSASASTARWAPRNCGQYVDELSNVWPTPSMSVHPNAGLPNALRPPATMSRPRSHGRGDRRVGAVGLMNIVGGCCGTSPDYIKCHRRGGEAW
jgi:5-methyltetrahydrofolate--homocysteine methyltransferase